MGIVGWGEPSWTQLILRYQQFGSDLNVRHTDRLSVVAVYLGTALAAMGVADERFLAARPCARSPATGSCR